MRILYHGIVSGGDVGVPIEYIPGYLHLLPVGLMINGHNRHRQLVQRLHQAFAQHRHVDAGLGEQRPGAAALLVHQGQQQVRRFEAEGKIRKLEGWMFVSAVLDDAGVCRGVTAVSLRSGEVRAFPADAIIVATGGIGFGTAAVTTGTPGTVNLGTGTGVQTGSRVVYHNGTGNNADSIGGLADGQPGRLVAGLVVGAEQYAGAHQLRVELAHVPVGLGRCPLDRGCRPD